MESFADAYPWTKAPLVCCAPMRLIALAPLAFEVSRAGGLGFVGAGSDASTLESMLNDFKSLQAEDPDLSKIQHVLPVGVGFICWAGEKLLNDALPAIEKYPPAAVWLFAPRSTEDLVQWTGAVRERTNGKTEIWIQVGTVKNAVEVTKACDPDVLVVQGHDAGGHGLHHASGLISLLPEVSDALSTLQTQAKNGTRRPLLVAAGGIVEGRGAAAALALGAAGIVLGTRYLASPEANIAHGYRDAVVRAGDGGQATARTKLFDQLRGTTDWPVEYGGRGVLNESWTDAENGMELEENKRLYNEALAKGDGGWGDKARLTTYAGTGVGLVKEIKGAGAITTEVRDAAKEVLRETVGRS